MVYYVAAFDRGGNEIVKSESFETKAEAEVSASANEKHQIAADATIDDPEFVDALNGDFSLQLSHPSINIGSDGQNLRTLPLAEPTIGEDIQPIN